MDTRDHGDAQPVPLPGLAIRLIMAFGGALWAAYGYYRFMTPYGRDVLWREDLGYSLILSHGLFILYNLPGVLALLATTWAALSCATALRSVPGKLRTGSQVLLVFAAVFGLTAMAGQLGQIDALTTGGLSFGALFLGLGLFSAGLSVAREKPSSSRLSTMISSGLMLLGGAGVMILLLRPLMFALQMLPMAFGAAACVVFGLGWILLALASRAEAKRRAADVVL
ncbi:hypothetical protein FBY31_1754 [Arthrobacter sp. SLBN-100]|uniref:hypothetical protein n=1 Tax=Arthrobacter sp. SLBN-100 TaxID=2768450 RepID=UPI0011529D37|nr:hypothetical protein [Arthrobacter sp. SLBN-100]TQJ67680.1 hypothetical protein FBY31_1754 [Arthrobacter sp. SLBN-100]